MDRFRRKKKDARLLPVGILTSSDGKHHPDLNSDRILGMANLTLLYGMRLLPSDDIEEISDAKIKLKHGREASVTIHIVEGSKEQIEQQLKQSIEAFFDLYPEL